MPEDGNTYSWNEDTQSWDLVEPSNMMTPNKMNLDFEPTVLGITVLVISIAEINEALQSLLLLATIVYTIIKIYQLLQKK